ASSGASLAALRRPPPPLAACSLTMIPDTAPGPLPAPTSSMPVPLAAWPSRRCVVASCRRGDRLLFAGLDATLAPGELLWLRGGNGRGKTSLLRLVAGLAAPEHGRILWGDAPTRHHARFAREMVYIAHTNALK